jgi:hypothetical protein
MKRTIAGILLLVGLGAGSLFADDGYWSARRHIERDRQKIAEDRRELQRDLYYGDYRAADHERRELEHRYRDLQRDLDRFHDRYGYGNRDRDWDRDYDGGHYGEWR